MNPRMTAAVVGVVTVVLGLVGLLYPAQVMGLLGFTIVNASQSAAALGEVRATYGGLFVVLGVYTLLAAMRSTVARASPMLIGLLWLGMCAGRLLGASIDGNPGLFGWVYAAIELLMGGSLVASALLAAAEAAPNPMPAASQSVPPS
jgi:drug/metabolite transporter superfamily protein YnfA